ncbi:MAG: TlpA family protein disulfide reductase, partial [Gemmatimonadota bacterium]|nr:TlpA family protein disulfide reductase [Gemmatimonadota bacterium]
PKADIPLQTVHAVALKVGDKAPRYALAGLSGDTLVVGDTTSGITLLNIWATWCESCREEFAELERIRKATAARGLKVIAVSVDQGPDERVRRFVQAQGSGFAIAHDADSRISKLYGVSGLPTSYLLDRTGRVLWTAVGDFRIDSTGMANAIEKALAK